MCDNRRKSILFINVKPEEKLTAKAPGRYGPIKMKGVFDTDIYHNGVAIEVNHHSGEHYRAIIADSGYDYIQCIRVDSLGEVVNAEIELEDYLNGVWSIRRLQ